MTIPSGSSGGKPVTRALVAALQAATPDADASNLRRIVDALVGKARDGDLAAIREIFDRIDGKAPAAAAAAAPDEPRQLELKWKSE
jgi:ribosomal protein L17